MLTIPQKKGIFGRKIIKTKKIKFDRQIQNIKSSNVCLKKIKAIHEEKLE